MAAVERPIMLVGMPGAGKTTVGRLLAERLATPFRDVDAVVEARAGMSIAQLFAEHGEPAFRDAERTEIERLLGGPPCVIAVGGGAFADLQVRTAAHRSGRTVWLHAPVAILAARLKGDGDRPLLGQDVEAALERLWRQREAAYREAELHVGATEAPDRVAAAILAALAGPHR